MAGAGVQRVWCHSFGWKKKMQPQVCKAAGYIKWYMKIYWNDLTPPDLSRTKRWQFIWIYPIDLDKTIQNNGYGLPIPESHIFLPNFIWLEYNDVSGTLNQDVFILSQNFLEVQICGIIHLLLKSRGLPQSYQWFLIGSSNCKNGFRYLSHSFSQRLQKSPLFEQ